LPANPVGPLRPHPNLPRWHGGRNIRRAPRQRREPPVWFREGSGPSEEAYCAKPRSAIEAARSSAGFEHSENIVGPISTKPAKSPAGGRRRLGRGSARGNDRRDRSHCAHGRAEAATGDLQAAIRARRRVEPGGHGRTSRHVDLSHAQAPPREEITTAGCAEKRGGWRPGVLSGTPGTNAEAATAAAETSSPPPDVAQRAGDRGRTGDIKPRQPARETPRGACRSSSARTRAPAGMSGDWWRETCSAGVPARSRFVPPPCATAPGRADRAARR